MSKTERVSKYETAMSCAYDYMREAKAIEDVGMTDEDVHLGVLEALNSIAETLYARELRKGYRSKGNDA